MWPIINCQIQTQIKTLFFRSQRWKTDKPYTCSHYEAHPRQDTFVHDNLFQQSVRNLPHKQALDNVPKHIVKTVRHISLPARTSQRPNWDVQIGWDARAVRFQTRNQCTAASYPEAGTFNLAGRLHIKICITTHTHTTERYTCTDRAAHPSHSRTRQNLPCQRYRSRIHERKTFEKPHRNGALTRLHYNH